MRTIFLGILCTSLMTGISATAEPAAEAEKPASAAEKSTPPVVHERKVTIAGNPISYRVTAGKLDLNDVEGKKTASIFHVSYQRIADENNRNRPVIFAFNGGPGSSSVWLHLGFLGPKIVALDKIGIEPPQPPVIVKDNSASILDVADLVFIDPVSTGYSRAADPKKASDFHGLNADVESVGDFIRRWTTENKRWASPKFLLGESYGGIRAVALANELQSRYGMSLNGVILLSSLLDFNTIQDAPGLDLPYEVFFPTYVSTAHFHGKIKGNAEQLRREALTFAETSYAAALRRGIDLSENEAIEIANALERQTSIPSEEWLKANLRISPSKFRAELLRAEGKVVGRFDSRVAWGAVDLASSFANYDPSYSLAYGAFSTAMLDYLGRDLGYQEDTPYEILTSDVQPWKWDASNEVVNVSNELGKAMRDNPKMKVLIMSGLLDMATPAEGMDHSIRHLFDLPAALRPNIAKKYYSAGHMFYLNDADLQQSRKDLLDFLKNSQ
ncbi:MAG: peptidase S10 [Verrucomicrobia bacterium]|nr:MAG: peptidase S10 [Verrucomicrobiota bacterium]